MDQSEAGDLKVLFPTVEMNVAGKDLKLHPFQFGKLARVAKLVKPIVQGLLMSGILTMTRVDGSNETKFSLANDFVPKLFELTDDAGEPLMQLIAFAVDQPRVWLDTVEADEGIVLAQKVWEVNADFFVKRVMPMLGATFTKSTLTGATSSQGSSTTATDGTT